MSDNFTMKQPQQLTEEIIQDDILYWRKSEAKFLRNAALALCGMTCWVPFIDWSELSGSALIMIIVSVGIVLLVVFSYVSQVILMRSATAYSIAADVVTGKDSEYVSSEDSTTREILILGSGTRYIIDPVHFTRQKKSAQEIAAAMDVGTEVYLVVEDATQEVMHVYLADRWMLPQ